MFFGGGNECTALSLHLNTTTEVLLSKTPNPQLLPRSPQHKWLPTAPGVCVHGVCFHCCVCALGMGKCRALIQCMGHQTWSRHFHFPEPSRINHEGTEEQTGFVHS